MLMSEGRKVIWMCSVVVLCLLLIHTAGAQFPTDLSHFDYDSNTELNAEGTLRCRAKRRNDSRAQLHKSARRAVPAVCCGSLSQGQVRRHRVGPLDDAEISYRKQNRISD